MILPKNLIEFSDEVFDEVLMRSKPHKILSVVKNLNEVLESSWARISMRFLGENLIEILGQEHQ